MGCDIGGCETSRKTCCFGESPAEGGGGEGQEMTREAVAKTVRRRKKWDRQILTVAWVQKTADRLGLTFPVNNHQATEFETCLH
jgi:hypothetical protein